MGKGPGQKYCFECAEIIERSSGACLRCGSRQPDLVEDARAFPVPGRIVAAPVVAQPPPPTGSKSKFVATMLALFLGGIGVHRFYLGRPVSGLFYLLFCWTFVPGIIALVEFLRLALMKQSDFDASYP